MPDRYACFADLATELSPNRDFRIVTQARENSKYLIAAPHGGKIEKGTSELTRAIARDDLSYYIFEGLRPSNNGHLHITSHKFDEPEALRLAAVSAKVIGVHGRQDGSDDKTTYLGGLDADLVTAIKEQLCSAGFPAKSDGHHFSAMDAKNICNRGSSGSGVQLEVPSSLREKLRSSDKPLKDFSDSVRCALLRSW